MSVRKKQVAIDIDYNDKYFIVECTAFDEEDSYSCPYDPGTKGSQWVEVDGVTCYDEDGNEVRVSDEEYNTVADMAADKATDKAFG